MIGALAARMRGMVKLPWPLRYLASAVLVVLAAWLGRKLGGPPFLFFFPTIVVVAVLFDHGCSVFATFFAAMLAAYLVLPPHFDLAVADPRNAVALVVFIGTGLLVGTLVEAMRHAIDELSKANLALLHAGAERDAQTRLLDAITEGTPGPVYVKDLEGRFVHVNSASAKLLGAPREAIPGTRDRDYLDVELAAAVEVTDQEIMLAGVSRTLEERIAQPGEAVQTFFSSKFPWRDADGKTVGLIGMSQNITAIKATEEQLRAADAQKELLLDDINHRIKNHLQTVAGLMMVGARRATTTEAAQDVIRDGVSRLSILAQVYTRLQLGSGAAAVDAKGFISELCSDLNASLVGERPILIRCETEPAALDSTRAVTVGLVINELVQNALKYAFPDDRPGEVKVAFHREDDRYRLSVIDNGVGIAPESTPLGTGNGQRLVRAMVQQLGGELSVEANNGTTVALRFPIGSEAGQG